MESQVRSLPSDEIMILLSKLNNAGKTIIMVTHENDIAKWARRVVRLRDGHIESDERNDQRIPVALAAVAPEPTDGLTTRPTNL